MLPRTAIVSSYVGSDAYVSLSLLSSSRSLATGLTTSTTPRKARAAPPMLCPALLHALSRSRPTPSPSLHLLELLSCVQ